MSASQPACYVKVLVASIAFALCLTSGGFAGRGVFAEESEWNKKIKAELNKPTLFEFERQSLTDVVTFLIDYHDINIEFNRVALKKAGIVPEDAEITRALRGVTLKSALNLELSELGLTYVIENEVLLITSPKDAKTTSAPHVYDVADLVRDEADGPALIKVIELIVEGPVADKQGTESPRPAHIQIFHGRLILRASQPEHDKVAQLLHQIRNSAKPSSTKKNESPP